MPTLSEADSRRLVEDAGVAVSPWTTASDAGSAAVAAEALGLPVVVKLCGDAIAHKTERGLIRLGLSSRDEAGAAAADLLAAAR
ncbi:MAG: acetate--CoA ligase family protein, partial [Actinomycetota bacterium]|nr:acetate--CoA ligase family protein [Actinomycetota bacterium]